jgi:hypothetical protein
MAIIFVFSDVFSTDIRTIFPRTMLQLLINHGLGLYVIPSQVVKSSPFEVQCSVLKCLRLYTDENHTNSVHTLTYYVLFQIYLNNVFLSVTWSTKLSLLFRLSN